MLNKLEIYQENNLIYSLAYLNNKLTFCLIDNELNINSESLFRAKITKANTKAKTAFIEYLPNQYGFINLGTNLELGADLKVQLAYTQLNENKQAKFKLGWNLVGKYLVYFPLEEPSIISLDSLVDKDVKLLSKQFPGKWVNRTQAKKLDNNLNIVIQEMHFVFNKWQTFNLDSHSNSLQGVPNYLRLLRELNLTNDCTVIVNDAVIFEAILAYQDLWGIEYISHKPNFKPVNFNKILSQVQAKSYLLTNEIRLEFGASSGINIIDINSNRANLSLTTISLLVLDEIYQQILLRNLQGIILCDFPKNLNLRLQQEIINKLRAKFRQDITKTKVLGFSNAGLLEIIRMRF